MAKYIRDVFGEPPADARGTRRQLENYIELQGVLVTLEHTYACCRQEEVQARIPGCKENWGHSVDLSKRFDQLTVAEFDRDVLAYFNQFEDPLAPCPKCGTMTWNRKHFPSDYRDERCSTCWFEDFNKRMEAERKKELAHLAAADRKMFAKGMRHRYSCWVHPYSGDDFQVDIYTNKPDPQVGPKLKRQYRATLVEVAKPVTLQAS